MALTSDWIYLQNLGLLQVTHFSSQNNIGNVFGIENTFSIEKYPLTLRRRQLLSTRTVIL